MSDLMLLSEAQMRRIKPSIVARYSASGRPPDHQWYCLRYSERIALARRA